MLDPSGFAPLCLVKWLNHLITIQTKYDSLRAARTAISVTIAGASGYDQTPLGKSMAVKIFMSNAALHRPPVDAKEYFDTAQILSFIWLMDHLATATPDKVGHGEQLDPGLRRALAQTLWAIDGHSRSSDTHCLFRERMLDLQRHKDKPAGSYCTRVSLYWPKEVRPGSARGNSSGKSGHWSKSFQIWSTTPTALCALAWLRAMFQENSSAAFMKVAVAGTVYTPAWHSHKKTNGVFSVNAPATVATDVAAVMTAAGCRQGETAHQLRGASSSKAVQLSDGQLKPEVLATARWSGDNQYSSSYEGFVRAWRTNTPPASAVVNPQQAQRWGVLAPESYVGLNIYATKAVHVEGQPFQVLIHARVIAIDMEKGKALARRALPRARARKDRSTLLRQVLPIFKIQAVTEPAWKRADVPFAVIADGHRRYVHFHDEEDALTQQRWC